ncbi:uncharacterized protein A4U43_C06F19450 [Asparagus officinalis]|uniref:Protein FAR1-RELATED SEQUENCE n=1 Tax=Asparagus officinalis TaxID=4686 RepID=A0A5P1EMZ0_ASPOF|nr:protein FAR1-RELATED SEQUENCE 11-like [Asparagus officinalis]ONK67368.1 uncharacterized protein A4U43_C06F19450 [Asparagus officinalis]
MTKTSSRNNGCLTQRRECPCGDSKCILKVEGEDDDPVVESSVEPSFPQAITQIPQEIVSVDTPPYVGQSFQTDDEAQEYYTNFARKNGFAIRRERSKGNPSHPLGVYKRELVCHRAGISLPRKTAELKRQRNKKSSRCKCEAQMIIKKNVSKGVSRWMVVHFSNVHNHELLDSEEVRHLPAYRNISSIDREHILALAKNGLSVGTIMRTIEVEKGVKPRQLTFTERDLRNFLQASKNINRENEGAELLNACKAMSDKNMDFRYDFTLDENNKLEHIAWSYPDSIHAYKVFGDVVVFDTSYRLYAYDRPVGVWFGVDNYGNAIFFGCVLLQNEKQESLGWALQSFLHLVDGKFPRTMLTDFDIRLRDAMISEMPGTKHVFGMWHVTSKLSSWFAASLGSQYDKFVSEFHRLGNLESPEEFDQLWRQMAVDFGLSLDKHVGILWYHRTYWALPHLRGFFFGGLLTTGLPVSMKSFFKGFLTSKIHLKDFIDQVAVAIELQNQAGEEATMRQNYQNIKAKTCMPIEEQALNILTPYAFDWFQKELIASNQFAVFETPRQSYLVRHRLQSDGGHLVSCNDSDENIECTCQEFEASGILCRHSLRVLQLKNCFVLPDKYLLPRWRRECSLFPRSSGYSYRSLALRSLASIIIQESSITKDRFDYVQWHMSKLLGHVRDMPNVEDLGSDVDQGCSSLDATVPVVSSMKSCGRGRPKKMKGVVEEVPMESS